jgi:hypothetical protein
MNRDTKRRTSRGKSKTVSSDILKNETLQTRYAMLDDKRNQIFNPLPAILDVDQIVMKKDKVHTFCRSFVSTVNISAGAGENDYAFTFSLSDLPSYAEFTSLFDQYRLIQVVATFNANMGYNLQPNVVFTAIDYDDNTVINVPAIQQYDTCLAINTSRFRRVINPRLAVAAYNGAFTGYANVSNKQWIDAASPNTQYYGLKVCVPAMFSGTTTTVIYNVTFQYYVQCRSQR